MRARRLHIKCAISGYDRLWFTASGKQQRDKRENDRQYPFRINATNGDNKPVMQVIDN